MLTDRQLKEDWWDTGSSDETVLGWLEKRYVTLRSEFQKVYAKKPEDTLTGHPTMGEVGNTDRWAIHVIRNSSLYSHSDIKDALSHLLGPSGVCLMLNIHPYPSSDLETDMCTLGKYLSFKEGL